MFSFLKFIFNKDKVNNADFSDTKKDQKNAFNSELNSQLKQTVNPDGAPQDSWVFIWDMTKDKVGHAAIQVGGSTPKMNNDDPGEYISIHPEGIPSKGLTSIMPLPGNLAQNLSEDMVSLGVSDNAALTNGMDGIFITKKNENEIPLPPDHIYKLKNLNTPAMRKFIQDTHNRVETGETGYQLFPNVNMVGFFKDSSAFIAQDVVEIEMHRRASAARALDGQVYNCTSLVSEILDKGGFPIKRSKLKPWVITPDGLSDEVSNKGGIVYKP